MMRRTEEEEEEGLGDPGGPRMAGAAAGGRNTLRGDKDLLQYARFKRKPS